MKAIADRVTVLRDGRHVTTAEAADLEPVDMARLMVGRDMAKLFPSRSAGGGEIVLAAEGISVPGFVEDVSFELRRGEILGFGGLVGAGRTELFEGLVGLRPSRGTLTVNGKPVHFTDARAAMRAGVTYLSEDRKGKGLLLEEELRPNLTLAALDRFARGPIVDVPAEDKALDGAIRSFDIRVGRRDLLARQLSGGNQQKLFLAKMMLLEPRIVIIDEPTRRRYRHQAADLQLPRRSGRERHGRRRDFLRDAGTHRPVPPDSGDARRADRGRGQRRRDDGG